MRCDGSAFKVIVGSGMKFTRNWTEFSFWIYLNYKKEQIINQMILSKMINKCAIYLFLAQNLVYKFCVADCTGKKKQQNLGT